MATGKTTRARSQPVSKYFKSKAVTQAERPELPARTSNMDPDSDPSLEDDRDEEMVRRKDLKEFCAQMQKFFKNELWALRKEVDILGDTTDTLEKKADATTTAVTQNQDQISLMNEKIRFLEYKVEDAENRDRRCNIRLRGVPETILDPEDFTNSWLEHIFPDKPESEIRLDRCHRALRSKPQKGDPPRDIVARFHHYRTKEEVCRLAREDHSLVYDGVKLQIFQDLAPVTLVKRKALAPITKILMENNTKYRWLFPCALMSIKNGVAHTLRRLEEGEGFLAKLGLSGLLQGSPVPSPAGSKNLTPVWSQAGSSRTPNKPKSSTASEAKNPNKT
ncbi:uncharacterized protein LOC142465416 [Ascaphus truei]|uniref:uncharacterized protein LOC142465416 n=1 Tax=Ascaphus truei TaxID=8439 RepID=UPI003F5A57F6